MKERISAQVEWPSTARRQEPNPGESDGLQPAARSKRRFGCIPISQEGPSKGTKEREDESFFTETLLLLNSYNGSFFIKFLEREREGEEKKRSVPWGQVLYSGHEKTPC